MVRAIHANLLAWRDDPDVHRVVLDSSSDRAFCAGGDVAAIRSAVLRGDLSVGRTFFAEEYRLNALIAGYPKPYVSIVDGITMGGGLGLSVHGAYVVATERAWFAMPEAMIGFFPDIGASNFLNRLPGRLGAYLGLTGTRVKAGDAVRMGLATHHIPRADLAALTAQLVSAGDVSTVGSSTVGSSAGDVSAHDVSGADVEDTLDKFAAAAPPGSIADHRDAIDRCFAAPSLEAVYDRLAAEGSEWAARTQAALRPASQRSLAITLDLLARAAGQPLTECLARELRLAVHLMQTHDFVEGVRSVLVDKDRNPRWAPAETLASDLAAMRALL